MYNMYNEISISTPFLTILYHLSFNGFNLRKRLLSESLSHNRNSNQILNFEKVTDMLLFVLQCVYAKFKKIT